MTRQLATLVGAEGQVVGIDLDAAVVELARSGAAAEGLENIDFRVGDASALDDGSYDVVYARFLLSHVADPASVVSAMVAALAPGGVVIVEDTDHTASFCHPESTAFRRYLELYRETVRRRGGNADIGPQLPGLLHGAGLVDVGVNACQPAGMSGEAKLMGPLTLERISKAVVEEGIASATEVEQVRDELYAYYEDPKTVMSLPRIIQSWGRASDTPTTSSRPRAR